MIVLLQYSMVSWEVGVWGRCSIVPLIISVDLLKRGSPGWSYVDIADIVPDHQDWLSRLRFAGKTVGLILRRDALQSHENLLKSSIVTASHPFCTHKELNQSWVGLCIYKNQITHFVALGKCSIIRFSSFVQMYTNCITHTFLSTWWLLVILHRIDVVSSVRKCSGINT